MMKTKKQKVVKEPLKIIEKVSFEFIHQRNVDNVALALIKAGYFVNVSNINDMGSATVHIYRQV